MHPHNQGVTVPIMPRIRRAQELARWIKVLRDNAARAEGSKNIGAFRAVVNDLRIAHQQLDDLRIDTDTASDGYTTAKAVRRALYMAARELELAGVALDEAFVYARVDDTSQITGKFYDRLGTAAQILNTVRFGPPIPRPRITKDERARMDAEETSGGVEQAYTMRPDSTLNKDNGPAAPAKPTGTLAPLTDMDAERRVREADEQARSALDDMFN